MNARMITLASVAATLMLGSLALNANGQDRVRTLVRDNDGYSQDSRIRIAPVVRPAPRLGIEARVTNNGLLIEHVQYGSLAWRAGLEPGDKIREINGRHIHSMHDYQDALLDAQDFRNGRVRLLVENVRWHTGQSCNRFVTRVIMLPTVCNNGPVPLGGTFGG